MQRLTLILRRDYPGTRRELPVIRFGSTGARPKAYLQAALHAEELNGTLLLQVLAARLEALEQAHCLLGEIVLVPCANPIGLSQMVNDRHLGRFHLPDRVNFNRGFPNLANVVNALCIDTSTSTGDGTNPSSLRQQLVAHLQDTRPESEWHDNQRQLLALAVDADLILDLHCESVGVLHLYQSSPIWPQGAALAEDLQVAAVILNRIDPTELSFSEANALPWLVARERHLIEAHQLPTVATVELRGYGQLSEASLARDADNLLRHLARSGLIDAPITSTESRTITPTLLDAMEVGYADFAGVVLYTKDVGERVEVGEIVARIHDPFADRTEVVQSRGSGVLFARRPSASLVRPGTVLFRIAGNEPLAHRRDRGSVDD